MNDRIKLVQGDNLPIIRLSLTNADGTPLDVTSAIVKIYFRKEATTNVLSIITCTKVNTGSDGLVQFSFAGTTLDVPPGQYEGEIEIDFGGQKQTVYDVLKFIVRAQFS